MIGKRVRNASTAQVSAANGNVFGRGGRWVVGSGCADGSSRLSHFVIQAWAKIVVAADPLAVILRDGLSCGL